MPHSFFQKIFGQKKSDSHGGSQSFGKEAVKNPGAAEATTPESTDTEALERQTLDPEAQTSQPVKKVNFLLAFVDLTDPFTPSEVAGEELPGPILSIMSAKEFDSAFLFHTPHTRENALATEDEMSRKYPECRVQLRQLPVSDPKDYSSLMGSLWRYGGDVLRRSDADENYVCVSSGTAEMRAVWFLLTTLGIVKAKLLQVGTPVQPLFGKVNVKELRLDTADWQTIRDLALPVESFLTVPRDLLTKPQPAAARGRWKLGAKEPKDIVLHKESKAGAETFAFDDAFEQRMWMLYGDTLPNLLPGLRRKFQSTGLPPDLVQTLTQQTLGRVAAVVEAVVVRNRVTLIAESKVDAYIQALRAVRQPESFAAFVNSICNNVLLEYYRASSTSPGTEESDLEAADVLNELKLPPGQLEGLRQRMHANVLNELKLPPGLEGLRQRMHVEDQTAEKVPLGAGKETEERVSSNKRLERPESGGEVIDGAAAEESPREEAPEEAEIFGAFDFGSGPLVGAKPQMESSEIEQERLPVPGLDDSLQELGIYVGSAVLRHAAERAGIAAESDLPVLLLGETGTGKERFAHLIHRVSPRGLLDLVALNCAAIPETLAESYLFGHMKGAFSGASSDKKGIFESADKSTLFLDEVAELSLEVQAKLLRVIQDGVVQRLGSTAPRKVNVRVIAASNRDLRDQVRAGKFREDLYFRLEVVQIKLPALRERRCEIPELALALLRQINLRRRKPRQLTPAALMRLERYDWPGNVRQLSNVLERSVLYARNESIDADDLIITDDKPGKDPFAALPEPFPGFEVDTFLTQAREQLFLRALAACNGNQTGAAERLGVSKQAVNKFVAGQNDNQD
jgi:DNA-binding NtrC family response regulator